MKEEEMQEINQKSELDQALEKKDFEKITSLLLEAQEKKDKENCSLIIKSVLGQGFLFEAYFYYQQAAKTLNEPFTELRKELLNLFIQAFENDKEEDRRRYLEKVIECADDEKTVAVWSLKLAQLYFQEYQKNTPNYTLGKAIEVFKKVQDPTLSGFDDLKQSLYKECCHIYKKGGEEAEIIFPEMIALVPHLKERYKLVKELSEQKDQEPLLSILKALQCLSLWDDSEKTSDEITLKKLQNIQTRLKLALIKEIKDESKKENVNSHKMEFDLKDNEETEEIGVWEREEYDINSLYIGQESQDQFKIEENLKSNQFINVSKVLTSTPNIKRDPKFHIKTHIIKIILEGKNDDLKQMVFKNFYEMIGSEMRDYYFTATTDPKNLCWEVLNTYLNSKPETQKNNMKLPKSIRDWDPKELFNVCLNEIKTAHNELLKAILEGTEKDWINKNKKFLEHCENLLKATFLSNEAKVYLNSIIKVRFNWYAVAGLLLSDEEPKLDKIGVSFLLLASKELSKEKREKIYTYQIEYYLNKFSRENILALLALQDELKEYPDLLDMVQKSLLNFVKDEHDAIKNDETEFKDVWIDCIRPILLGLRFQSENNKKLLNELWVIIEKGPLNFPILMTLLKHPELDEKKKIEFSKKKNEALNEYLKEISTSENLKNDLETLFYQLSADSDFEGLKIFIQHCVSKIKILNDNSCPFYSNGITSALSFLPPEQAAILELLRANEVYVKFKNKDFVTYKIENAFLYLKEFYYKGSEEFLTEALKLVSNLNISGETKLADKLFNKCVEFGKSESIVIFKYLFTQELEKNNFEQANNYFKKAIFLCKSEEDKKSLEKLHKKFISSLEDALYGYLLQKVIRNEEGKMTSLQLISGETYIDLAEAILKKWGKEGDDDTKVMLLNFRKKLWTEKKGASNTPFFLNTNGEKYQLIGSEDEILYYQAYTYFQEGKIYEAFSFYKLVKNKLEDKSNFPEWDPGELLNAYVLEIKKLHQSMISGLQDDGFYNLYSLLKGNSEFFLQLEDLEKEDLDYLLRTEKILRNYKNQKKIQQKNSDYQLQLLISKEPEKVYEQQINYLLSQIKENGWADWMSSALLELQPKDDENKKLLKNLWDSLENSVENSKDLFEKFAILSTFLKRLDLEEKEKEKFSKIKNELLTSHLKLIEKDEKTFESNLKELWRELSKNGDFDGVKQLLLHCIKNTGEPDNRIPYYAVGMKLNLLDWPAKQAAILGLWRAKACYEKWNNAYLGNEHFNLIKFQDIKCSKEEREEILFEALEIVLLLVGKKEIKLADQLLQIVLNFNGNTESKALQNFFDTRKKIDDEQVLVIEDLLKKIARIESDKEMFSSQYEVIKNSLNLLSEKENKNYIKETSELLETIKTTFDSKNRTIKDKFFGIFSSNQLNKNNGGNGDLLKKKNC